ncbi:MAG TPA: ABC-ATPase UvrA, partial [Candidatus Vogelbacteria bacterium]|nr:ABC-ATPase UvrA [Candidatus Vogelbacteria bacterium]
MEEYLWLKGAKTHNLKNIDLQIPRNKMVVFTGLSGSGKSSLAFDTIFAEGQRRYVESLSSYARQFLRKMPKPEIDDIGGLSPAISIDQKSRSQNPRSTVATITETYDYLRILYARIGRPYCLVCSRAIEKMSPEEIILTALDKIEDLLEKKGVKERSLTIYAPLITGRKGEYYQLLYDLLDKGYEEIILDGRRYKLRERIIMKRHKKHDISVLIDEIPLTDFIRQDKKKKKKLNNTVKEAIYEGTLSRLSEAVERALRESEGIVGFEVGNENFILSAKFSCPYDGFSYPEIEPRLFSFNSPYGACPDCHGLGTKHLFGEEVCPICQGARLRPEALNIFLGGDKKTGKNILQLTNMTVEEAVDFLSKLKLSKKDNIIAEAVLKEIKSRLNFLLDVGLNYITLNRRANTLSGGEAQRIRLAGQLGSRLVGTLYVLDEPTIGLHQKDNEKLIKTLINLRDLGNTIIVVEHDEETILSSDYLVDIGPGAGRHGGKIVVSGNLEKVLKDGQKKSESLTVDYLLGKKEVPYPEKRRTNDKGTMKIRDGNIFNIKNLNVDLPLGKFICITGVSGSGKSTFLYEILHKNLKARFDRRWRSNEIFNCRKILGLEYIQRAIMIDQSPIGRTPRSNPATYTGAFTFIRDLFTTTELARIRGYGPGRFSFNVRGGRCEACQGNGQIAVEMHFLPTIYVNCDVCNGRRFEKETLEIR